MSNNLTDLLYYGLKKSNNLKKKILIVNVYYPPQDWGGATHVVRDNVNELCQNYIDDFDIVILYSGRYDLLLSGLLFWLVFRPVFQRIH